MVAVGLHVALTLLILLAVSNNLDDPCETWVIFILLRAGHGLVLDDGAIAFFNFVRFCLSLLPCFCFGLVHVFRCHKRCSVTFEDGGEQVAPSLERFQLFEAGRIKLLIYLLFFGFLVILVDSLWNNRCAVEDTGQLGAQVVAFAPGERWVCLYFGVHVAGENVFDHAGGSDVLGLTVGQLDPIVL